MNAMPSGIRCRPALLQEAVWRWSALAAVGFAVPYERLRCTQNRATTEYCGSQRSPFLGGLVGGAITGSGPGCLPVVAIWRALRLLRCHRLPILWEKPAALVRASACSPVCHEESFMRRGIEAFEALDAKRAILASAAYFALLHVGALDVSAGQLVLLQAALKFGQALLFGVILGCAVGFANCVGYGLAAFIHVGFDVLYMAPNMLLTEVRCPKHMHRWGGGRYRAPFAVSVLMTLRYRLENSPRNCVASTYVHYVLTCNIHIRFEN